MIVSSIVAMDDSLPSSDDKVADADDGGPPEATDPADADEQVSTEDRDVLKI